MPIDNATVPIEFAHETVSTLIARHATIRPECPAIVTSRDSFLTYDALGRRIAAFGEGLRSHGVGHTARVAIMLPDGPELAFVIVAVVCHAVAVPLNPRLTASELDDLFAVLAIDAVVVSHGVDGAVHDVAARHGARLIEARCGALGILEISGSTAVSPTPVDSKMPWAKCNRTLRRLFFELRPPQAGRN